MRDHGPPYTGAIAHTAYQSIDVDHHPLEPLARSPGPRWFGPVALAASVTLVVVGWLQVCFIQTIA